MSRTEAAAKSHKKTREPQPDALFHAAADQAPLVMWIVNAKGVVTYLNHSWYELVGGTPPKWYGHEWGEVVHPEDLAEMRERWKTASVVGTIFEGTRRVRAQDGSWHTLSYKATPVFGEDGLAGWVGIDSDITEMVAAQQALREANAELEAFSYSVSHDLRAPLVTVRGFTQILSRRLADSGDAKSLHYLERVGRAVEHMGNLIDGLLSLAHLAKGDLRYQAVDLSALAREILAAAQRQHPERQVTVSVAPRLTVQADRRLMAALMENLLGNAWKFTAATSDARIEVGLQSRSASESVFFVKDNGAGFDMAAAAKLFTAFERLHSADEFPGTGIGLATVQRIVTRHGGRVWAEAKPGEGSCFYFALPKREQVK